MVTAKVTTPTTTNITMDSVVVTEGILIDRGTLEMDKDRTIANSMEIITAVKVVIVAQDSVSKDLMAMDFTETKKELMNIDLYMMTAHKIIPNMTTMDQITLHLLDRLLTLAEGMFRQ